MPSRVSLTSSKMTNTCHDYEIDSPKESVKTLFQSMVEDGGDMPFADTPEYKRALLWLYEAAKSRFARIFTHSSHEVPSSWLASPGDTVCLHLHAVLGYCTHLACRSALESGGRISLDFWELKSHELSQGRVSVAQKMLADLGINRF